MTGHDDSESSDVGDGVALGHDRLPRFGPEEGTLDRVSDLLGEVRLSAATSGVGALVAALLVGRQLVGTRLAAAALLAGVGLAGGLYALNSDRPGVLLAGGVALTPAALLLVAALGVGVGFGFRTGTPVGHLASLVVLLLSTGGFAAVVTTVPLSELDVLAGSFPRLVALLVPAGVVGVVTGAVAASGSVAVFLANLVVDSPEPVLGVARTLLAPTGSTALLTALLYVVAVMYLLRLVVASLPVATLFPPRRRPMVGTRVDAATDALGRATLLTGSVGAVVYAAALATGTATPDAIAGRLGAPVGGVVAALLTAVWLRVAVLIVAGVLVALLVGERVRRLVRRRSEADLLRQVLPALGATVATLVVGVVLTLVVSVDAVTARVPSALAPTATTFLSNGVFPAALTVAFASLVFVGVVFVLVTTLAGSPLLPRRALGPAMAAGTVFALALVLVFFGGTSLLAFAAAAFALVVWDAGEFATGLREDLPAGAETIRAELVHVGASVGVGVVAVVGAGTLDRLVTSGLLSPASETALAAGALALAFATVVVLLSVLRE